MAVPRRSRPGARDAAVPGRSKGADPITLQRPALVDTGVWTWARDRRFPSLASWFNDAVRSGLVLVCELVMLELVRVAANEARALEVAARLDSFDTVAMPDRVWQRAREVQLLLAASGGHRRVPPADLLIAASAELAAVPLVHYDRDYERIAGVTGQAHAWFVPDGALA